MIGTYDKEGKANIMNAALGVHVTKSKFVEAPIIEEYPLTLECKVDLFKDDLKLKD